MFRRNALSWWLLVVLCRLCRAAGGQPPHSASPCPQVLRYLQDGAAIAIPSPRREQAIALRVELSVPAAMTRKYPGKLQLQEGRRALMGRLAAGDRRPVRYSLRVPPGVPLPTVTRIAAMGKELCRAEAVAQGDITTSVTLDHVVRPEPFRLFLQSDNGHPPPALSSRNTSVDNETTPAEPIDKDQQDIVIACGSPARAAPLVAEGEAAAPGDWPWLAAVFTATPLGMEFHCAGTLVSDRHVVTAAHCVHQRAPDELLVSAGRHNVRKWTEPQAQSREVRHIHVHPDYVALNMTCDLAVLELSERVSYDWFVRPACVDWEGPTDLTGVVGLVGTVVGWGRDELGRRLTPEPRAARMPIVAQEACLRSRPDFVHFTSERTFCAGFRNGSGPCNGDSGSGLLLPIGGPSRGRWVLRGIVSLSLLDEEHHTCDLYHYVVFTDVAKFRDWLRGIVRPLGSSGKHPQHNDSPIWDSAPAL